MKKLLHFKNRLWLISLLFITGSVYAQNPVRILYNGVVAVNNYEKLFVNCSPEYFNIQLQIFNPVYSTWENYG